MDMVRLGSFIMGQVNEKLRKDFDLRNPFYAFSRILAINELAKGDSVGYGPDYISTKKQRIAIIAAGYYDGFTMEAQDRDLGITGSILQMIKQIMRIIMKRPLDYVIWQGNKLTLIRKSRNAVYYNTDI